MATTKRKMAADGRKEKTGKAVSPTMPKVTKNSGPARDTTIRRTKMPLRSGVPVKAGE